MATSPLHWWQDGVIYQIYPRSFQDSNGDGIGDLPGILQRLDYLQSLHIRTLWLSPIYPSPMKDFGYDVSDYTGIHPIFGRLDDFMRLLEAVHARGMKLILDLVPNHTSDQHPWFVESRSSLDSPKRDWYIWADPKPDGSAPNNWISYFGGPAWSLDPQTGQYYLHQFLREQPELNYRNPAVLQAMLDDMRVWLERGIDGFRVDVIWLMIKDALLRDNPPDPDWKGGDPISSLLHSHTADQPEVHKVIRAMRALIDEYSRSGQERIMVGEIYLTNDRLVTYYGSPTEGECHLPFNFQLIDAAWDAGIVRRLVEEYEAVLPLHGWPNWVLGNHDKRRLATRVGAAQARVATMLLLTLRGTPTCYYGDEIGMHNVPIPAELVQDPPAVNMPEIADIVGRDPVRTPMQWDSGPNAGFCAPGVTPWLPLADDYAMNNVAAQEADSRSMLSLFRALTSLRKASPALAGGSYATVHTGDSSVLAYTRHAGRDVLLVVLNFGSSRRVLNLSLLGSEADLLVATDLRPPGARVDLSALMLGPDQGLVLRLPGVVQ